MENAENKSLISTGSSNLAKTEKLLSNTQKILSEIKPQYESVRIGNQEWMTRNLDVDRFRNGDFIPHVESVEDWKKAGINGQPVPRVGHPLKERLHNKIFKFEQYYCFQ
ncbi:MAG: hypothetical protein ACKOZZ_00150 [Bacteroidota bacterium]